MISLQAGYSSSILYNTIIYWQPCRKELHAGLYAYNGLITLLLCFYESGLQEF